MYVYRPTKTIKWSWVDFLTMAIMVIALVVSIYFA